MKKLIKTLKYLFVWRFVYLYLIICFFVDNFFVMIFFILITLISRTLSMNPISPLGHSVLWKKHALNHPKPVTMIKAQIPYSSPPQDMDKHSILCSPLSSCANSPESVAKNILSDTPKSIDIEPFEEHHELLSPLVMTSE